MTAYYNENDPFAAAWLQQLIVADLITPGVVDTRSIEDVTPNDVRGFTQVHMFAGCGIWSLAARVAGWPDERPLWTGSCPCQPFSAAGKGGGFADERHLWPAFHWLIDQCRPERVVGEQVASRDGLGWLDLVSADLEGSGYTFGAVDTCAAGFGAPHIRQRLYWVADSMRGRAEHHAREGLGAQTAFDGSNGRLSRQRLWLGVEGTTGGLADATNQRHERSRDARGGRNGLPNRIATGGLADSTSERLGETRAGSRSVPGYAIEHSSYGATGGVAHAPVAGRGQAGRDAASDREADSRWPGNRHGDAGADDERPRMVDPSRPGPTNGLWRDADWLRCRDEKWRPVESSPLVMAPDGSIRDILAGGGRASDAFTFPLAEAGSFKNRVGLLRGAGNAINLAQAAAFIGAMMRG